MNSVRILIVSQYFWPEGFRINDIAKTLVEKGARLDILTGKPNYPKGRITEGYRAWVHSVSLGKALRCFVSRCFHAGRAALGGCRSITCLLFFPV